jgi:type VI protein secretion system component VasA
MDKFFSEYSSINSFTRLRIKEVLSGETFTWSDKAGGRPLA